MGDYNIFLPSVVAALTTKKKNKDSLSEDELKAIISATFQESVIEIAQDSNAYQETVTIDVFKGERFYSINPPDNFLLKEIVHVSELNYPFPATALVDDSDIILQECPDADYEKAWKVRVSLVPTVLACDYKNDFCHEQYQAIFNNLMHRLHMQKARTWFDLELATVYLRRYEQSIIAWEHKALNHLVPSGRGDYTHVLSEIMGIIGAPTDTNPKDLYLRESEVKTIVNQVFKSALHIFTKDTGLLRVTIPVSFFENQRHYPIDVPSGYFLIQIEHVFEDQGVIPVGSTINKDSITLSLCPDKDIDQALRVELSVIPREHVCCVDPEFIGYYKSPIVLKMRELLHAQQSRPWYDLALVSQVSTEYKKLVSELIYESVDRTVPSGLGDYTSFLIDVFSVIGARSKEVFFTEEQNIKQLVSNAFKRAVLELSNDSRSLRVVLPLDFFAGESFYKVYSPNGFEIIAIEEVFEDQGSFDPSSLIKEDTIKLGSCPNQDVQNAVRVEVSLRPMATTCCFDRKFIDAHHNILLSHILSTFMRQRTRRWFDMEMALQHQAEYKQRVSDVKRDIINRVIDRGVGDYRTFLPAVWNALPTRSNDDEIDESEALNLVNQVFKDTVIDFARQTGLYRHYYMLDLFAGESYYPIPAPKGHTALTIKGIETVRSDFTWAYKIHDNAITLPSAPKCDYDHVFRVEQAIIPHHTLCFFDPDFIDRYYEAILAGMFAKLSMQPNKRWQSIGLYDRLNRAYSNLIKQAKMKDMTNKLSVRRSAMSEY